MIRIDTNELFGRHVVLNNDINAGETVVEELPFAIGPKSDTPIVCLGCYNYLSFNSDNNCNPKCPKCGWPLCRSCSDALDHMAECEIFSKSSVPFLGQVSSNGECTQLNCITPLSMADPMHQECSVELNKFLQKQHAFPKLMLHKIQNN